MVRHPVAIVISHITYAWTMKVDYSRFSWGELHGKHVGWYNYYYYRLRRLVAREWRFLRMQHEGKVSRMWMESKRVCSIINMG
jgi:hypothetical protein